MRTWRGKCDKTWEDVGNMREKNWKTMENMGFKSGQNMGTCRENEENIGTFSELNGG